MSVLWSTDGKERWQSRLRLPQAMRVHFSGKVPKPIYIGPDDEEVADQVLNQITQKKWVAVDTEHDMDEAQRIIVWSLSDGSNRVCIHEDATRFFKEWLESKTHKKVFHNALHDIPVFKQAGIDAVFHADTMVMDFYADDNRLPNFGGGHGLKDCARDWLGLHMKEFHEVFGDGTKKRGAIQDLRQRMITDLKKAIRYASLDAYATIWLFHVLRGILKNSKVQTKGAQKNLWDVYRKYDVRFLSALHSMEAAGVAVEPIVLDEIGQELDKTLVRSRWVMQYLLPESIVINRRVKKEPVRETLLRDNINPGSIPQLQAIFYDHLGLKSYYPEDGTQARSTDMECLKKWADEGCVFAEVILSYRRSQMMRSNFVGYRKGDKRAVKKWNKDGTPASGDPHKGLLHWLKHKPGCDAELVYTNVNPIGTVTGRLAMYEPNLMQVPKSKEKDPFRIRRAFIPRHKNGCLIVADYSMAELRILAHLSHDKVMMEVFRTGGDLHAETGKVAFNLKCAVEEVKTSYPEKRDAAKVINFGIVYGMGAMALARKLGVSEKKAQYFIDAFMRRFQGAAQWLEDIVEFGKEHGYVETILGRRRRLPYLQKDPDQFFSLVEGAKRQAQNAPIQGSVGDIMRLLMPAIDEDPYFKERDTRMVLQVHDELVLECDSMEFDGHNVRDYLKQKMESIIKLRVPLVAEAHIGPNWEAAKG